jgi:error-prone DNA polymerase
LDESECSRHSDLFAVRIGLRYVKGLRLEIGNAISTARQDVGPYITEYDLKRRVPSIRKNELTLLASVGAFNWTGETHDRRTALWRAEHAGQNVGPLFANIPDEFEIDLSAPLVRMRVNERLEADFFIAGFTLGPHPMAYQRAELDSAGVMRATDLTGVPDGTFVRIAGAVIARQRPGTASGFIFLSNEDETGISNAIIHPKLYEGNRVTVTTKKFLLVEGVLQNQDGVISVKASAVRPLDLGGVAAPSRNFH